MSNKQPEKQQQKQKKDKQTNQNFIIIHYTYLTNWIEKISPLPLPSGSLKLVCCCFVRHCSFVSLSICVCVHSVCVSAITLLLFIMGSWITMGMCLRHNTGLEHKGQGQSLGAQAHSSEV